MTSTTITQETPTIDQGELDRLLGIAINDFGAVTNAPLVVIGDRLGLYKALAAHGPLTYDELAKRTGTAKRYVREWCGAQAAGGYITYDPTDRAFHLSPEQTLMLATDDSPAFVPGAFQLVLAASRVSDRLETAFQTGEGIGWHEQDAGLFEGTERFFRPGYNAHLIAEWIPALDGVQERLEQGIRVADIGCGHGASTLLMAQAFPNSEFIGFDYHEESIRVARQRAEEAGLADRVRFEVADAAEFEGEYGLVTSFDCLHDMGDPIGVAAHVRSTLAPGGTWMVVEPFASDALEENLNPIGRAYYSTSTHLCVPASLAQEGRYGLGAQAGPRALRQVIEHGGFGTVGIATQTPFNLVIEATV